VSEISNSHGCCTACGVEFTGPDIVAQLAEHVCAPGNFTLPPWQSSYIVSTSPGTTTSSYFGAVSAHPSNQGPKRWLTTTGVELTVVDGPSQWRYAPVVAARERRSELRLLPGGE
jgi:hypothetical protein